MKWIIRVLFLGIISAIVAGYVLKSSGDHIEGDRIIGIAVLVSAFVLMPVFIYHRAKGKKLKDYMLTKENLNKMNKKNIERPENQ